MAPPLLKIRVPIKLPLPFTSISTPFPLAFYLLSYFSSLLPFTLAYIPALPSNSSASDLSPNNGLLPPINCSIQLNWQPMGIFKDGINQQLRADNSSQTVLHQGVLLHFSELNATSQPPAVVPWIAMINCDSNSSVYSIQDDIFTLARDRGAAAAMLYSLTASSCRVNDEYIQNFEKPLDVFSSANLQGARLIESQFSNVLGAGYWFQSDLLNSSAPTILKQIHALGFNLSATSHPSLINDNLSTSSPHLTHRSLPPASTSARLAIRSPGNPLRLSMNPVSRIHNSSPPGSSAIYLIATLASSDQTATPDQQIPNGGPSSQNNAGGGGNPNTGLAMIILYAITGCVTFMFLIVIVSGAVRAVRHPERYGPRARLDADEDPFGPPRQTRAAGLGKAILDTFPVVKFGQFGRQPASEPSANKTEALALANMPETPTSAAPKGSPDFRVSAIHPPMAQAPPQSPMILPGDPSQQSRSFCSSDERTRVAGLDETPAELGSAQVLAEQRPRGAGESRRECDEQDTLERENGIEGLVDSDKSQTEADKGVGESAPVSTADALKPLSMAAAEVLADLNNSMTCPICVCDFEAEDEIRVLPCDARHQFHKECVDPWLLNESRFCPLCRWDLSMRKDGSRIVGQEPEGRDVGAEGTGTSSGSGSMSASGEAAETSRGGRVSGLGGHGLLQVTDDGGEGGDGIGSTAAQSRFVKYLELMRQKGAGRTVRIKKKKNRTSTHLGAGGNGIVEASGSR